jgi:hypothetical protein
VTEVEFTPDGTMLVSGGEDGTARFWNVQSGEEEEEEEAARGLPGGRFAFTKASSRKHKVDKFLVTAEGDILRIFFKSEGNAEEEEEEDRLIAFFRAPGTISTVDTSGAHIAVGCKNGEVLQLRAAVLLT